MGPKRKRLPREVWVAGISLKGLWPAATIEKRMSDIVNRISEVLPFEPDIICLPETVNISWVNEEKMLHEIAEEETYHEHEGIDYRLNRGRLMDDEDIIRSIENGDGDRYGY